MNAADKTFGSLPTLPLPDDRLASPASHEGRTRLGGAYLIARDRIRPDPEQPRRRFDPEAQKELHDSVKRLGILQPITVRYLEQENVYQIITGERRFLAASAVGLTEIPCWVQSPKEGEILLHQIVENWQRLDMHPFDLADALSRLRDANGYTQQDLARETGKSRGEISKLFSLLDLDPDVQKAARDDQTGRVSRGHLYAVRELSPLEQLTIIQQVQQEPTTVAETEALVAKKKEAIAGRRRRGAPVSHHRFSTSQAIVSVTFRKKSISIDDIVAALDEARLQALPLSPNSVM